MRRLKVGKATLFDSMIVDHKSLHEFDEIDSLLDWDTLEALLSGIYIKGTGGASYPPLMMFRALLMQVWHSLSDVQAEKMLSRDLLFRRFCRLSLSDSTPDHSTISRFRGQLTQTGLYEKIFLEINDQLATKGAIIRMGEVSIVDATVIEAHQCRKKPGVHKENTQDEEAGWSVKKGAKGRVESTFGFKAHANVDEDGFVKKLEVTSGNIHDSQLLEAVLTGTEEVLYTDSAYSSAETYLKLVDRKIKNKVGRQAYKNRPLTEEDKEHNRDVRSVRYVVERTFGAFKRHYGAFKTRFLGGVKTKVWVTFIAIAHNLKKAAAILYPRCPQDQCA